MIHGLSADRFNPSEPITREQMAVLIASALKYKGVKIDVANANDTLAKFNDAASINKWAAASAAVVVKSDIIGGKSNGTVFFASVEQTTRTEATEC